MSIAYRLKKKEFILMLDLFGDTGSLEQKFGDVYIDSTEYDQVAERLHRKGFVTVTGNEIAPESGMAVIMKTVFSAPVAFADESLENWLYCSDDVIVHVCADTVFGLEYHISVIADAEDRENLSEKFSGRKLRYIRGGTGEVTPEIITGIPEGVMK